MAIFISLFLLSTGLYAGGLYTIFISLFLLSIGLYAGKPGSWGQIPCLLAGLLPKEKGQGIVTGQENGWNVAKWEHS